jgi:acetyl-CoA carboxylase alpha subunit
MAKQKSKQKQIKRLKNQVKKLVSTNPEKVINLEKRINTLQNSKDSRR